MPNHTLWLAAVILDELSLWVLPIACLGLLFALASNRQAKGGKLILISALTSSLVGALILNMTLQTFAFAQAQHCLLSISAYLFGSQDWSRNVTLTRSVVYAERSDISLKLDVYQPKRATASDACSPSVIVVHGGSWRHGHRSEYKQFDYWLSAQGYVVFDIDYRLAQSGCYFPAQADDVETAIEWVKANAAKYGGMGDRIALIGRSAGAQLALLAAYSKHSLPRPVCCVVSYYAPTDLLWDYDHPALPDVIDTKNTLENYFGGAPDKLRKNYLAASPADNVSSSSPPTLLFHGGHDQVVRVENAEFIEAKLKAAQIPVIYELLPFANHGFDWRFDSWNSQLTRDTLLTFLKKYLRAS